jgi:thiol-disulfide isomerase/thioredoxin
MSASGVTKARFEEGLTLTEYVAQMRVNRERFLRALDQVVIGPEDTGVLARLGHPRRVLVITEDWCGTSLAYVPLVARLVEHDPAIELRIVLRDANPDLMDRYLKHGRYRSIPVIVFFDAEMREVARFIEQPPA